MQFSHHPTTLCRHKMQCFPSKKKPSMHSPRPIACSSAESMQTNPPALHRVSVPAPQGGVQSTEGVRFNGARGLEGQRGQEAKGLKAVQWGWAFLVPVRWWGLIGADYATLYVRAAPRVILSLSSHLRRFSPSPPISPPKSGDCHH